MNTLRFQPWSGNTVTFQDEFKNMMNRFLRTDEADQSDVVTSQWAPRVDIREEDHRFVLAADVPGVDPNEIEIQMDRGVLSIRGERKIETTKEDGKFTRVERSHGVFYRRFALPDSADPAGISASGKLGVLEISIPKRPESAPRRIAIQTQ